MENLAMIRSVFMEKPTVNGWWEVARIACSAEYEERELLQDYIRNYINRHEVWKVCQCPDPRLPLDSWVNRVSYCPHYDMKGYPIEDFIPELVCCPPGYFEVRGDRREIKEPFLIFNTPVTYWLMSRFRAELEEEGHNFNRASFHSKAHPYRSASWVMAIDFCNILSREFGMKEYYDFDEYGECHEVKESNGFRLPTLTQANWILSIKAPEISEFRDELESQDYPVKCCASNHWGIYAMSGLVWEWSSDLFKFEGGSVPLLYGGIDHPYELMPARRYPAGTLASFRCVLPLQDV